MANTRDYGKTSGPRRRFAAGGAVYAGWSDGRSYIPNNWVSGSGVDPRTIYSPEYIKSQEDQGWIVDPAYKDQTPAAPAAPAADAGAGAGAATLNYPTAQAAAMPSAPEFKPQTLTQTVARQAVPTQAQEKVEPYVKSGPVV